MANMQSNVTCQMLGFSQAKGIRPSPLSLAPGFSRVLEVDDGGKPFQRFFLSDAGVKPLKRLDALTVSYTRLKPGANEIAEFASGR